MGVEKAGSPHSTHPPNAANISRARIDRPLSANFKGGHPRWVAPTRATGGVEGLTRYYEACLSRSDHRVKTTLEGERRKTLESERERFISIYRGAPSE